MTTPYIIIMSDSEDEYLPIPTADIYDSDSDVDMDISSSPLDSFLASHYTSENQVDPEYTPSPEEPMETDPSEEEEEEENEDDDEPSDDGFDTADSLDGYTTPTASIPALHPRYYREPLVGVRTRLTARKSVPVYPTPQRRYYSDVVARRTTPTLDSTVVRGNHHDVHMVPTTPITTATTHTSSAPTTTPILTPIPATTTTTTPQQDHGYQYQDWMRSTLQTWRQAERVPSTYEIGESSTAPGPVPISSILVARLARLEREQRMLEQDFGSYNSWNTANIRQSFDMVRHDASLAEQAAEATHARVMHTRGDLATLTSRLESSERRIAELEEMVRRLSGASTSTRPGHPPR